MSEVVPIRAGEAAGTYACGDVVALKSGGRPMTVRESVRSAKAPAVVCDWLADDATLFSARFPAAMLTPAEAWEAQP